MGALDRLNTRPRVATALEAALGILGLLWVCFLLQISHIWVWLFSPWLGEGILPRDFDTILNGPISMPLLHGGWEHLIGNTLTLAVLLPPFFLSHTRWKTAWGRLALLWIASGLLLWLIGGGDTWHIGASGVAYALIGYLAAYGLRGHWVAFGTAVLVLFFQFGSIWSGLIPSDPGISYSGHWSGLLVGAATGWYATKGG